MEGLSTTPLDHFVAGRVGALSVPKGHSPSSQHMMAQVVTPRQPATLEGDAGSLTQVTRNNEEKPQVVGVGDTTVTVLRRQMGGKGCTK